MRVARNKGGRNIRVPADMNYADWKRVYIDKTLTLKDWQAQRANNFLQESSNSAKIGNKNGNAPASKSSAKDIEEANNFAKNVLGIPNASYAGCNKRVADEWNQGLLDAFSRFPELRRNVNFVGEYEERRALFREKLLAYWESEILKKKPALNIADCKKAAEELADNWLKEHYRECNEGAVAFHYGGFKIGTEAEVLSGFAINKKYAADFDYLSDVLKQNVTSKFHPVGCDTIKSVLDHEIGHYLDELLGISSLKEVQDLFNSKTFQQLTDGLSEYAWSKHSSSPYKEFVAEAWAEYCNNLSPREIAKKIGAIIEREYERRFQS